MLDARTIVFESLLEFAEQQPMRKRATLYKALAEFAGDPVTTAELQVLASDIEAAEARCREFQFQFSESTRHPKP
jgi:hypothetical protein